MIEVSNLNKTYGNNRGITDISFSVPEGQIVGFLGPNGAGKTTTMNIITGYISADSGNVSVAGLDVLRNPLEAKRCIGYLPEHPPLYPSMTVEEYLDFAYELKGVRNLKQSEHIAEICELTGLTEVYRRIIAHLSKGYRQRVGLAQALIGKPEILILDEPTVGLDPRQIVEIRNVIKDMGSNCTIILSTHILSEAAAICERVLVVSGGVLVGDDKPENLASALSSTRSLIVRVAGERESALNAISSIETIEKAEPLGEMEPETCDFLLQSAEGTDIRKDLFNVLSKNNLPILMLRSKDISLEDVFLSLTDTTELDADDALPDLAPGEEPEHEAAEEEGAE